MAIEDNNIIDNNSRKQVRQRLLDAAESLFCEKGFDETNIRELTSLAGCNLAAVNYHFGGKNKLYHEVFHRHMVVLRDIRIAAINKVMSGREVTLEELLGAFANSFIEPLVGESGGRRFIKLMTREMLDPHLPRKIFLEEMIIPVLTALQQALAKVCPGLDEEKAMLSIHSVVAQLLHIIRTKEMFSQADNIKLPTFNLPQAVDHIVEFSAAGIRAAAKGISE